MRFLELTRTKPVLTLAAVATLTCALGVAVSAHVAWFNRGEAQAQASQAPQAGPGMMGPGQGMRGGPGGPGGRGGPGGPGGPMGILGPGLRALDLTEAQQKQVQAILDGQREEQQAIGEKLRTARQALGEAIAAETFDEAAVRAKAAEVASIEADQAVLQAKTYAAVRALLTPEQVKKLNEMRGRMQDRRGRGPGRPRPQQDPQEPAPQTHDAPGLPETV